MRNGVVWNQRSPIEIEIEIPGGDSHDGSKHFFIVRLSHTLSLRRRQGFREGCKSERTNEREREREGKWVAHL